jgi:hypothetical protein
MCRAERLLLYVVPVEFTRTLPEPESGSTNHPEREQAQEGSGDNKGLSVLIARIETHRTRVRDVRKNRHQGESKNRHRESTHRYTFQ